MYSYVDEENVFKRMSSLFVREPESNHGLGVYYIVDLLGRGGDQLVSYICENHGIPIMDLRDGQRADTIRECVDSILETSPTRCAFIVETWDNPFMHKV